VKTTDAAPAHNENYAAASVVLPLSTMVLVNLRSVLGGCVCAILFVHVCVYVCMCRYVGVKVVYFHLIS